MREGQVLDRLGGQQLLREKELELVPASLDKGGSSLGAHADPINALGRLNGAVGK